MRGGKRVGGGWHRVCRSSGTIIGRSETRLGRKGQRRLYTESK